MSIPKPTTKYLNEPGPVTDPTQEHLSVAGKTVLVTGGGTTIGAATVEAFAKAKAKDVFLAGRRLHLLEDLAKKLSNTYPQTSFHAIQTDVSKESDVQSLFKEISKVGRLDILVANAGYLPTPSPLSSSDTADWWSAFEINVLGTYNLAKAFINQPLPPKSTPVFISVNTGTAHAGIGKGGMSGYSASKLAAASLVEFLHAENPDMKFFSVRPGVVPSDMSAKANLAGVAVSDSPELQANFAVWLASPESDFLKGRFIWANWDTEELVEKKEKIEAAPVLFRLALEGWSNNFAALK